MCSGIEKVHIDDGSLSTIVGTGCIHVSSSLSLSFVFHVPNFKLNLLFVSHLMKSLNYSVTFFLPNVYFRTSRRNQQLVKVVRSRCYT